MLVDSINRPYCARARDSHRYNVSILRHLCTYEGFIMVYPITYVRDAPPSLNPRRRPVGLRILQSLPCHLPQMFRDSGIDSVVPDVEPRSPALR